MSARNTASIIPPMLVGSNYKHPLARRAGSARALAVLVLLVLAGVGAFLLLREGESSGGGETLGFPSELLALRHVDGHEEPASTLRRTFEATRELAGVTVESPAGFKVQPRAVGNENPLMILLRGKVEKHVDIAGVYDPATFNQVVLRFLTFTEEALCISFLRDGKEFLKTSYQVLGGSKEPQRLLFDLPQARTVKKPFDTLRINIQGRSKPTGLFSADLVLRPLEAWLPSPDSPAPVDIGRESRIAVGLSSLHPLEVETILPPGARLAFGYGQPAELSLPGQGKPKVRVTITQGELEQSREFELEDGDRNEPKWSSASWSLSRFKDRRARVRFELTVAGNAEGLCALASPVVYSPGKSPPTVLLITSDTHRADHLGSAKSRFELATPALDALADRGVLFEQAYSSTNVTNPSHIALMTATHPRDTEIINNHVQLSGAAQTLAECYREAGYVTIASLCAKHLGHTTSGLGQGFDRMIRPNHAFTDAEVAIDWLQECLEDADGRPLFVWLHVFDAHHPYGPPEKFDKRYWVSGKDPFDPTLPPLELQGGVPASSIFPPDLVELRDLEFPRAQYKAEITYLDDQLGRVFSWPRFADATIAMTADHGESFGEHGVYYDHAGAYPQNLHVPLILAGPGLPVGVRSKYPAQQIDIGRTLLDLSGLENAAFPGRDLLEVVQDPNVAAEPQYSISAHGFDASITHQRMHLVLHLRSGQSTELRKYERCHTELYDLDADPECTVDLWGAAEYAERGANLRKRLVEWLAEAKSTGWAIEGVLDAETQAELVKLGYAASAESKASRVWFEDCEE